MTTGNTTTNTTNTVDPILSSGAFIDDDSWAQPRSGASRGWKVLAALLGISALGLSLFGVGVRFGKSRVPVSANPFGGRAGGSGAGGLGAGLPGGGGGLVGGGGAGPSAEQLAQIFGQANPPTGAAATSDVPEAVTPKTTRGVVTAITDTSVTIKALDGTTVTIALNAKTAFGQRSTVDRASVEVGQSVEATEDFDGAARELTVGDLVDRSEPSAKPSAATLETTTTIDPSLGGLLPTG
jgi:hypothetical protein